MAHTATRKTKTNGRQAQKSSETKKATLQAAIDCFVELGYARTSTKIIAKRAGITRGAMLHHFPTKRDLLNAAVEYLMDRRMDAFGRAISKLKDSSDRNTRGIDVYWRHLNSPLFVAYHELIVAARTDPELNAVMKKATRKFEERWLEHNREIFPEWAELGPLHEFAIDLVQFAMEGMAFNRLSHDVGKRQERIRRFLNAVDHEILNLGTKGKTDRAVSKFLREIAED